MGYEIVETSTATYYVISDDHSKRTREGKFDNLPSVKFDSLIVEDISGQPEHRESLSDVMQKKLELYQSNTHRIDIGDIPTNVAPVLGRIFTIVGTGALVLTAAHPAATWAILPLSIGMVASGKLLAKKGEHSSSLNKLSQMITFPAKIFLGKKATTHRNAVIAEKAEQFIAPAIHAELNRKPVIGIVYGAYHAGDIARLLREPRQRRRILERIPTKYRQPQMESLGTFRYTRDGWKITQTKQAIRFPTPRTIIMRMKARARLARMKGKKWVRRTH